VLNVFLKAVQQALGSLLKENLGTIATGRVEQAGAASQARMAGATETRQPGVDKSKDDLQEHVTEGLPSAAKDGAQET
jgi:hypothetical protein